MYITRLNIKSFRNISELSIKLKQNFNVFYGQNGAGKTSLLESLYYLTIGKSFRTNLVARIIQHQQDSLMLTARFYADNSEHFIGFERHRNGSRTIKLDGETQLSIAPVARLIPLQVIGVDSYRFFSDGPKQRRAFLDWGVFHVKQSFLDIWQQFSKILKQRNACLKQKRPKEEIRLWNQPIIELSEQIHSVRIAYIYSFEPVYKEIFSLLLPELSDRVSIRYKKGWSKESTLAALLDTYYQRDLNFGFTQDGPHRADIQIYIDNTPADDILSQGQQKLAAYALHLAQGVLFEQQLNKSPIYLIDDLPSELDSHKQAAVINILKRLNSQVLITCIDKNALSDLSKLDQSQMFHVEHGNILRLQPNMPY